MFVVIAFYIVVADRCCSNACFDVFEQLLDTQGDTEISASFVETANKFVYDVKDDGKTKVRVCVWILLSTSNESNEGNKNDGTT